MIRVLAAITPTEAAGLITAAGTAGAAMMGALNAWRRRKDEARREESAENTVVITQAQGANVILDATIRTLNDHLDRAQKREETWRVRAEQAEAALDACQMELRDCRDRRA